MNCEATLEEGIKGFNFLWITDPARKKSIKITLNPSDAVLVEEFLQRK